MGGMIWLLVSNMMEWRWQAGDTVPCIGLVSITEEMARIAHLTLLRLNYSHWVHSNVPFLIVVFMIKLMPI